MIQEEILMPQQGNRVRKIRIYLPDRYDALPEKRFPVLYMHDGQNMVDPSPFSGYSWDVAMTLKRMEEENQIEGVIVVGIDTDEKNRISEYTQAIAPKAEKILRRMMKDNPLVPSALPYAKFIVETLKPSIDERYRTLRDRENTGTFGSSCGGNVSLFLGTAYHETFGIIGAFSPAYWIVREDLIRRIQAKTMMPNTKFYLDMGKKETWNAAWTLIRDSKAIYRLLRQKGIDDSHIRHVIDSKGTHTELFWQARFPDFIRFAFQK